MTADIHGVHNRSDVGGVVISAGSSVDPYAPKPGTRVAAFAPTAFEQGKPDHGAFQTHVIIPAVLVTPILDGMSFNEASLLPMTVLTAWAAWYRFGIARDTAYPAEDKKGMLIWGGTASIGTGALHLAELMGFRVYATASERHHEYPKSLGASEMFDYRDEEVVGRTVEAANRDGVTVSVAFDAVGQTKQCMEILKELKGEGVATLASAVPVGEGVAKTEDVEVKYMLSPEDEEEQREQFHFAFNIWSRERLEKGEFVPSPKIKVVGKGLESLMKGLDEMKKGVSRAKFVIEV